MANTPESTSHSNKILLCATTSALVIQTLEKEVQHQKPFESAPENGYTECLWHVSPLLNGYTAYNVSLIKSNAYPMCSSCSSILFPFNFMCSQKRNKIN